jgi:hypothetical protein
MARSDKVPFRREYEFSSDGYLTESDGEFVGDILSLHLEFDRDTSYKVEGKVGITGKWRTLSSGRSLVKDNIDLRSVEYVRVSVFSVETGTNAFLFGYEDDAAKHVLSVKTVGAELDRSICDSKNMEKMVEELKKLNTYMSIIVGDKL